MVTLAGGLGTGTGPPGTGNVLYLALVASYTAVFTVTMPRVCVLNICCALGKLYIKENSIEGL